LLIDSPESVLSKCDAYHTAYLGTLSASQLILLTGIGGQAGARFVVQLKNFSRALITSSVI
jgi:hypothetical protein